jgi:hypothetical protein
MLIWKSSCLGVGLMASNMAEKVRLIAIDCELPATTISGYSLKRRVTPEGNLFCRTFTYIYFVDSLSERAARDMYHIGAL